MERQQQNGQKKQVELRHYENWRKEKGDIEG